MLHAEVLSIKNISILTHLVLSGYYEISVTLLANMSTECWREWGGGLQGEAQEEVQGINSRPGSQEMVRDREARGAAVRGV